MNDTFKKFDLSGKSAFITGGGTGLGYIMARGLANLGAKVMISARREDVLKASAEKLTKETGGQVLYSAIDLSNKRNVAEVASRAAAVLNGVDIFIGNAGQDGLQLVDLTTDDTVEQVFQVNTIANIALARIFLPHMREKKWGRVIFSSSCTSKCGTPHEGMGAYAASKGALNAFTRVAASETGHDGITFNSLILGIYLTEILQGVVSNIEAAQGAEAAQGFLNTFSCMTAVGRLGQPEEVEGLVQLLASNAGSYITGAEIPIDGGVTITMKPNMPG